MVVASEVASDVLIVVLEAHAKAWHSLQQARRVRHDALTDEGYVHSVCTFLTAYQLLSDGNRLAVLATTESGVQCLFSDLHLIANPAAASGTAAALQVAQSLQDLPGIGAMERSAGVQTSAALSVALCTLSKAGAEALPERCRVLLLQCCGDVPGQYIACMNGIFSAQRLGVAIDGLSLASDASSFVEQAAHMTDGLYLRPRRPAALLQYLLDSFAANRRTRAQLQQPRGRGLTFRATCFCHRRTIDIGYVCSACLSVFCSPLPECLTCGTEFGKRPHAQHAELAAAAGGPSGSGA